MRRHLAFALALLPLLTACGEEPERIGEPVGELSQEIVVCPDGATLEGIDVSYYQGQVDWPSVAGDGIAFAIARVNHGDFMDPEFDANWAGIRDVGMLRGAYQYFDPGGDPVEQATTLIDRVGTLEPGDLPPVIDVESTDGLSASEVAANVRTWIDLVEGAMGRKPLIYTGSYFWNDNVTTDEFAGYPLWIAHYTNNCPNIPDAWMGWRMWQYSSTGSVAGISGNVDTNRFNGGIEGLHDLAANGYRASIVSLDYPDVMAPGETAVVELTLRNDGARTWNATTALGTTEPRDRDSVFAGSDWLSDARAVGMPNEVASGGTVTLRFDVVAPSELGEHVEHFNLVQEGVAWFSDIAPGGGPSDDTIALSILVDDSASSSASSGSGGATAGAGGGAAAVASDDGSCSYAPTSRSHGGWWLLAGLLLTARRRRSRSRR